MTPEQIQQWAREAGFSSDGCELIVENKEGICTEELQAFAKCVANNKLEEVNREVSGSPLLSNLAAIEVQAILRKMKS